MLLDLQSGPLLGFEFGIDQGQGLEKTLVQGNLLLGVEVLSLTIVHVLLLLFATVFIFAPFVPSEKGLLQ